MSRMKCCKINLTQNGNSSGKLCAIETKDLPFEMKRLFYIWNCPNDAVRGLHANRNSQFVMLAVSGSVNVKVFDGQCTNYFILNSPTEGIYLPQMVWKEMYKFTSDAVLLVISDCIYDRQEYIYDFDMFLKEANKYE